MHAVLKQFVPYDIAIALKEAGFDEPCFAIDEMGAKVGVLDAAQFKVTGFQFIKNSELANFGVASPLYQQAFEWLELNNIRIHDCWIVAAGKWSISVFDKLTGKRLWPDNFLAEIEPPNYLYYDKREAWNEAIRAALKFLKKL